MQIINQQLELNCQRMRKFQIVKKTLANPCSVENFPLLFRCRHSTHDVFHQFGEVATEKRDSFISEPSYG